MPEVSRFYGIVVRIFYDDHNPPHLHAEYGEHEVLVNINTLAILGGNLPARALGMDTTVRAAASRDYEIVVVEDGHTTADRPHMDSVSVIRHHNWVWKNLILPRRQVTVLPATSVIAQIESNVPQPDRSRPTRG
jgi:hypothetical protein